MSMGQSENCTQNLNPQRLVHEGTSRDKRHLAALNPDYVAVDEKSGADIMVFAQAFTSFISYYNSENIIEGNWQSFFDSDVSILLAVATTSDINFYRNQTQEYLAFLRNREHEDDKVQLRNHLEYLFSCCASLAIRINHLEQSLPKEIALKQKLQALITNRLAPALRRLISYFEGGHSLPQPPKRPLNLPKDEKAAVNLSSETGQLLKILGADAVPFSALKSVDFGEAWLGDSSDWSGAYTFSGANEAIYEGSGTGVFQRASHIATHYHFTSALDQFLKEYAYVQKEARLALEESIKNWNKHEPHYALFLAFLELLDKARNETNTLTKRHLDFYYQEILHLKKKAPKPGRVHLLAELARHVPGYEFKAGDLFKAGKDDTGKNAFFTANSDFVANQAKVAQLKTLYKHESEAPEGEEDPHAGRLFASPVTNSDDGIGAELTTVDLSWAPFFNKTYQDGALDSINMPQAEAGVALFSHHLLLAGGERTVTVDFHVSQTDISALDQDYKEDIECLLSVEKEWYSAEVLSFTALTENGTNLLRLELKLSGSAPPVLPYVAKDHGYSFDTGLPVLLVKLKHRHDTSYLYESFQGIKIEQVDLKVVVTGLKTFIASNDFGPLNLSKPFQPWGAKPAKNNSLVIGSREAFQKELTHFSVSVGWHSRPAPYGSATVKYTKEYLQNGVWGSESVTDETLETNTDDDSFEFTTSITADTPVFVDAPDFSEQESYNSSSRYGFVRLRLEDDFNQAGYETGLIEYIKGNLLNKPDAPIGPSIGEITLDYTSSQSTVLTNTEAGTFEGRHLYFNHLGPFGYAEQHARLKEITENNTPVPDQNIYLLPQLRHLNQLDPALEEKEPVIHEAEFFIGIEDLVPPQNLALLFQVADGTADPQSNKPDPHIHWSYLRHNEWLPFQPENVIDETNSLLHSSVITFAMPRDASKENTLLASGLYWIRAAVAKESDAVCRLLQVSAQAFEATFQDQGNDPAFGAKVLLPETIHKLSLPNSSVKGIVQPFESFGGRGEESAEGFQTRISERLRHKDRAITMWDYERLVLEAFADIYKVKCLNHTQYEENTGGGFIYKELAPGHVTVVTIPLQESLHRRDPLRPYTSLGLIDKVEAFLKERLSCFVKLHVKNPEFEEVKVSCKVRFREGVDETFYLNTLKEEIIKFLSPWAFEGYPSFSNTFQKSVIIDFIEELPYVDYLTNFSLTHTWRKTDGGNVSEEKERVEGSRAVSILVSARDHQIEVIQEQYQEEAKEVCRCQSENLIQ